MLIKKRDCDVQLLGKLFGKEKIFVYKFVGEVFPKEIINMSYFRSFNFE
jgi:hypothetical protein